jgi:hypothetical protein
LDMATGTSISGPSSAFHVDDPEQAGGYRTLSVPAIVGLVLGLASPLCFGAPLLFVIPIAGIAVSLFALMRIDASEGGLAGRSAAVVGLVLSTAMLVAPTARSYVLEHLRTRQATDFATNWVNLVVSGQTEHAFKLTSDSLRGAAPADPAQKGDKPPDPYDTFRSQAIVKDLSAVGADAQVRLVEITGYDPQSFERVYVRELFEVTPAKPSAQPMNVAVTLQHTRLPREGRSRWLVWTVDDGSKASSVPTPSSQ